MSVHFLNSINVNYGTNTRKVSLYYGDITSLSKSEAVDFLAVSAFPNDYEPFPNCTIGELAAKGVSVKDLSKDKEVDYRPQIPCWISKPVSGQDYDRIIVYEPYNPKENSIEQAGYVFAAIADFLKSSCKNTKVAIPLFSTHYGGVAKKEMLIALFFTAVHWGAMKFPFTEIKIVIEYNDNELIDTFKSLKTQYENLETLNISPDYMSRAKDASSKIESITVRPDDVLTRRQLFAILIYTSSYYLTIHRILETKDKKNQEYINHLPLFESLDTALMNIKPYTSKKLYRGKTYMTQQSIDIHKPGANIVSLSYTSYAYEPGHFYNDRNYKFQMEKVFTGSLVENYSFYPFEKEVLFDRHFIYTVKSVTKTKSSNSYLYMVDEKEEKFRR